jgi:glycosyltransferase involved in cell wall biosynthesis
MPLVTIGLPVYNGMPTIGDALMTLLMQDYPNLQIVVSDNASTDGTLDVCQALARQDSRLRIISKQINEGAVANFRTVLDAADGEYFMWAAADDYWYPQFVSRLLPLLQGDADVGVAMCAVDRRLPDGRPFDLIRFVGDMSPNGMGHFRLLSRILAGGKYNLFIYGLFRTPLLRSAMRHFPVVLGGDRQFICQIALATRFSYLDQVLLTRTHQPTHSDSYIATMAKRGTLRQQLASFARMILESGIIPTRRKAILPYALMQYAFFGFRQKPIGGVNMIKKIARRLYLTPKLFFALLGSLGVFAGGLGYLMKIEVLAPGISVALIWVTLLASASCLLIRRWIIQCQKTLIQRISAITETEQSGVEAPLAFYKIHTSFGADTNTEARNMDAESRNPIKQPDPRF